MNSVLNQCFLRKTVFLFILLVSPALESKEANVVKVLSWWGYLNDKNLSVVNEKCGVKVEVDEYYSNSEFLRRINRVTQPDVMIYSQTVRGLILDKIQSVKKKFKQYKEYNKFIRKYFERKDFVNTNFFQHSLTGFLFNRKLMKKSNGFEDLLKSSKSKIVGLIDDPIELSSLFKRFLASDVAVTDILNGNKVFVTNSIEKIVISDSFGFAYTWSGSALSLLASNNDLDFSFNDLDSRITSDFISTLNQRKDTQCVLSELSSRDFLKEIQSRTNYFSPYFEKKDLESGDLNPFYSRILSDLSRFKWLESVSRSEFKRLETKWKKIKLNF